MILILKGGTSAEREVSLWTARSIGEALTSLDLEFAEVDAADMDWLDQVGAHNPSFVFIALHGPFGEDGAVQKALEERGIAYSGSDAKTSEICIDKEKTKEAVKSLGVHVPVSKTFSEGDEIVWEGTYPVVVKPNGDGSSFGITIVKDATGLEAALKEGFAYGKKILIEEFIEGTELTCGVIALDGITQALPLVEIRPTEEFFNFEAKYTESKCLEICPAPASGEVKDEIQRLSVTIFNHLGCKQYARADWILREGTPYFLEINTLPGMTKTSLIIKELAAAGIEYSSFISALLKK